MEYKIENYNEKIDIISISGELGEQEIKILEQAFSQLVATDKGVVVNIGDVDYLNSMVIGFLIHLKKRKNNFVIGTISKNVEMLFNQIGLDNVFKIFGSKEDAIKYFEENN